VTAAQLEEAPQCAHLPKEASFPLLFADLLGQEWEQVLFLDADLLVLDDVSTIWEIPLDNHLLAAVQDAAMPYCSSPRAVKNWQALGIPPEAAYFNGGVMLLHLPRWQEREGKSKVRQYLERTGADVDFLHQEAMNSAFWGQWKPINERWNLIASRAGRPYDRSGSQAWRNPGIVHFAGQMKPWRAPVGGPFQASYQSYLDQLGQRFAREPATAKELLKSFYDRKLRDWAQPVEQFLWEKKLL
jgi:lipopolysaccharide biosynthesis glycosyltransferase